MSNRQKFRLALVIVGGLGFAALVWAAAADEQGHKVSEKDVPPTALAALKELSNGAALSSFSEEKSMVSSVTRFRGKARLEALTRW